MEQTSVPIAAIETIGPDAIAIEFETPDGFDASPGQFIKLLVTVDGEELSRFYTISSPTVGETFELTIGIDPDGDVTPALADLEPGDEALLSGPYGNAFYEGESDVLVLAGGPGIGPAVGIAQRVIDDGGDAAIVYRDDEPIHVERLDALRDAGAEITVLSDEQPLDESVASLLTADMQVFVYGFAEFLDDSMDALAAAGGEPDGAKVENFG